MSPARLAPPPPYKAQLATLVDAPPEGDDWVHEQKFDGFRMGLRLDGKVIELWSRRDQDWTSAFPTVVAAAARLGVKNALLDGEVAAVLPSGITSFQALQNRRPDAPLAYFAFDLLHLDGEDLRGLPLVERKERLRQLLARARPEASVLRYSDHVRGEGQAFFQVACKTGLEGIVSKLASARYRASRNSDWQKTKCLKRQELVIGGFTEPEGARAGVGALLVGHWDSGRLRWAGKVGTGSGWTATFLRELRRKLDARLRSDSPFDPPIADAWLRRNARWVEPDLVVEVAFSEWTDDGRVRHASVQGLRDDKASKDVVRETPVPSRARPDTAKARADVVVAGVRISHPERVVFADVGLTKGDVARYYDAVAERMLPHVAGRPLTLLLCTETVDPAAEKGGCQMMRHGKAWGPEALRRVRIRELRKTGEYLVADTREALVSLAQMGIVEVHTWNAQADAPYLHDRIVFDFDPGPAVGFEAVVEAALLARRMMDALGLRTWVKTTGGKGLHVVAPVEPTPAAECLAFARSVAMTLVHRDRDRFTTTVAKQGRAAKILIDVLRNNRTNTSVAAYSLRARAGAPVSLPLAWDDLDPGLDPRSFNARSVAPPAPSKKDPWRDYATTRQRLPTPR